MPSSSSASSKKKEDGVVIEDDGDIRHEIEEMRAEALERLSKLAEQMEELNRSGATGAKDKEEDHKKKRTAEQEREKIQRQRQQKTETKMADELEALNDAQSNDGNKSGKEEEEELLPFAAGGKKAAEPNRKQKAGQRQAADVVAVASRRREQPPLDTTLLEGTRWKVVFNVHREPGTWMPPAWGASGDRLLFEVVVDFTGEDLNSNPSKKATADDAITASAGGVAGEYDDFLQGPGGSKRLNVVDAWVSIITRELG